MDVSSRDDAPGDRGGGAARLWRTKEPVADRQGSATAPGTTSAEPADSPEAHARAFVAALAAADRAKLRDLYIAPEQVAALVQCERDAVAELRAHIAELEPKLVPVHSKLEIEAWKQSYHSVLRAGAAREGCTAKRDFELAIGTLSFKLVSDQASQTDAKTITLVKTADGWRVWKLAL